MIITTEAIVLETRDFREKDKIIGLLTRQLGKINAIAFGAKESKKRFQGSLDLFSLLNVILHKKQNRGFFLITQSEIIEQNRGILDDIKKISAANVILELTRELTVEGETDINIFNSLKNVLSIIANSKEVLRCDLIFSYSFKLFENSGFIPSFEHCYGCKKDILNEWGEIFFEEGFLFCEKCGNKEKLPISKGTIKVLNRLKNADLKKDPKIRVSLKQIEEGFLFLESTIKSVLQKELLSLNFFKEIK